MLKKKNYNNIFHIWLITLILLISSIIIVGGLTRLTDSGLSITEWELLKGIFPPTNTNSWIEYFESYKQIPQFKILNSKMTLEEFKYIFLWEYAHRLLARFIGLFFLIPFLFLVLKKLLNKSSIIRLSFIFFLILLQGLIGWYMVSSGLTENISVSHYRLAFHLITAFIIFSSLFWIFINHYNGVNKKFFQINRNFLSFKFLIFLIFTQIAVGALVSGLDAGKIYQTWPLMNDGYFPDDQPFNKFFNLNSPSFVQFVHRNIAYLIFFLAIYLGIFIYRNEISRLYVSYVIFILLIFLQVLLGITVLFSNINILIASSHQISSIFLVASSLYLYHRSI